MHIVKRDVVAGLYDLGPFPAQRSIEGFGSWIRRVVLKRGQDGIDRLRSGVD